MKLIITAFAGMVIGAIIIGTVLVATFKPTTGGATVPLDMHCRADQAIAWSPATQHIDCVDIADDGRTLEFGGK